jgi:hypothetical protein
MLTKIRKSAILDPSRRYRYRLTRAWGDGKRAAVFIMLNPSTADETVDDPTIRKCIGFASRWGCTAIHIGNLFAYRAKDPAQLRKVPDPVGLDNAYHLRTMVFDARLSGHLVIAAWGAQGGLMGQDEAFIHMARGVSLKALRLTKKGMPEHPLYVPYAAELVSL